ncbi:MAG: 4Fe-4S dicluster domain-containing protein, partial [bacterium]
MKLSNADFYEDYAFSCNRCRSCTATNDAELLPVCPSFDLRGYFSASGGGKAHAAQGIITGAFRRLKDAAAVFYDCTLCLACRENCPVT